MANSEIYHGVRVLRHTSAGEALAYLKGIIEVQESYLRKRDPIGVPVAAVMYGFAFRNAAELGADVRDLPINLERDVRNIPGRKEASA